MSHKKNSLKSIEKKVEKHIKKNWKKIIFIVVLSFIIISTILFFGGLRIRFALHDELIINLEPGEKSFTIPNDKTQNITFFVETENSVFCQAKCSYDLYDRSQEVLLDEGNLIMGKGDSFNKTYALIPYKSGSGQKIYNFDVQCSDIQSFLCTTGGTLRRKSSFIILNYQLTQEEELLKSELKPSLQKSFNLINNASFAFRKSLVGFNLSYIDFMDLDIDQISQNLNSVIVQAEEASNLWSEEDYMLLASFYKEPLIDNANYISFKTNNLLDGVEKFLDKQNILISKYNSVKKSFFDIVALDSVSLEKFYEVYDYLKFIEEELLARNYISLSNFEKDVDNIDEIVSDLNGTIHKELKDREFLGINITAFEYAKKCYLGYCSNLTDDICYDLNVIISEYDSQNYNSSVNVSGSDYYIITNGSVKIIISNESSNYYDVYCLEGVNYPTDILDVEKINLNFSIDFEDVIKNYVTENVPLCCVYGDCSPCCLSKDCKEDTSLYPVIFIHGHSLLKDTSPEPLLNMFNKIQYQMQDDGFINGGIIRFNFNLSDYNANEWGLSNSPMTIKASYYYDYFYSLGKYIYVTKSSDNIDTYVIRLNDIINLVKYRTGKSKVNIVAHSMGGLVSRRYLQVFGEDSVNKVILIATPNQGVTGDVQQFCQVFGEKRECEDMYQDSIFMKKLNDPNYSPSSVKFYTILGSGCDTDGKDGDGIVVTDMGILDYAKNSFVEGVCEEVSKRDLHNNLLDIDKYPAVYLLIKSALEE